MQRKYCFFFLMATMVILSACTKDNDDIATPPPPSGGAEIKLNGGLGGSAAQNSVFVDLSTGTQDSVKRDSWDLGFYNGSDFRVILNYTLPNAMIAAVNKTDLSAVSAADTAGMVLESTFSPTDLKKVDAIDGDLTGTAIAAISGTETDNKVYILNRGALAAHTENSRGWIKLRIVRKGNGYLLQYAGIADTDFKTIEISKEEDHQFSFVSLGDKDLNGAGPVTVEPPKAQWDFVWTLAAYKTSYQGTDIYYPFSDLVLINNRDGVEAAEVMSSTVSYEDFAEADIAGITFSNARDAIGDSWRATSGGNGQEPGVFTDRFYVIKDPQGNIYKLRFIDFTEEDGGRRGYPDIAYQLVLKGEG
ncbi:HmuY family protein [Compostibacter hankyongensis]|uniref:HmuY protein n=1 Tax=Compostibacter hankyongensis TaxID=1007089 RepID=A0ABP8FQP7_9BACT